MPLGGKDDLSSPQLQLAVAALAEEQKADTLLFLENDFEALAILPIGRKGYHYVNNGTIGPDANN